MERIKRRIADSRPQWGKILYISRGLMKRMRTKASLPYNVEVLPCLQGQSFSWGEGRKQKRPANVEA